MGLSGHQNTERDPFEWQELFSLVALPTPEKNLPSQQRHACFYQSKSCIELIGYC